MLREMSCLRKKNVNPFKESKHKVAETSLYMAGNTAIETIYFLNISSQSKKIIKVNLKELTKKKMSLIFL